MAMINNHCKRHSEDVFFNFLQRSLTVANSRRILPKFMRRGPTVCFVLHTDMLMKLLISENYNLIHQTSEGTLDTRKTVFVLWMRLELIRIPLSAN